MDNKQPENPSAFPMTSSTAEGRFLTVAEGMTLRDYFAAKAMATLIREWGSQVDSVSELAYEFADAMLRAREVKPKDE